MRLLVKVPFYNSGIIDLYERKDDNGIYPKTVLKSCQMGIWFRELNIYDSMKVEFNKNQINVNRKIAIPQYRKINSRYVVRIGKDFYTIYNIVHVTTKDGFKESELTLIRDEGINEKFIDTIV